VVVQRYTASTSGALTLTHSTYFGGLLADYGYGIDANSTHVVVVGVTDSSNTTGLFPTHFGSFQRQYQGNLDGFVLFMPGDLSAVSYCSYWGSVGADRAYAVALDSWGVAWITGSTTSTSLPAGVGGTAYNSTHGGGKDVFLAAMDSSGNTPYATYLGRLADEESRSLVISDQSAKGSVTVGVGAMSENFNFPMTPGAYDPFKGGSFSWVFAEHSTASYVGSLDYSTFLGGGCTDVTSTYYYQFPRIDHSPDNATYVLGGTAPGTEFPVTSGAPQLVSGGNDDGWLAVVKPDGGGATDLHFATYHGGGADDHYLDVAFDSLGRILAAGSAASADIQTAGLRSSGKSSIAYRDTLFARYNAPEGYASALNFSSCHYSDTYSEGQALGVDPRSGDLRVVGTASPTGLASTQDLTVLSFVLPEEPSFQLMYYYNVTRTGHTLEVRAQANATVGLVGAEVDEVLLTVEDEEGEEYAEDEGVLLEDTTNVYTAAVDFADPGVYTWSYEARTFDNGRSGFSVTVNITGRTTYTENETTLQKKIQQVEEYWGITLSDYFFYAWIVAGAVLLVFTMARLGLTGKALALAIPTMVLFAVPTFIAEAFEIAQLAAVWGIIIAWALLSGWRAVKDDEKMLQNKAVLGGLVAAMVFLAVSSVTTGAHWAFAVVFSVVAVGAGLAMIPPKKQPKFVPVKLESIGKLVTIISGIVAIVVAVLPFFQVYLPFEVPVVA
jgi:hypothetical protein